MNRPAASRLQAARIVFSSDVDALPGPVRQEQIPLLRADPEIFVYKSSVAGVAGLQIAGATMSEDIEENAAVYGKKLNSVAILKGTGQGRSLTAVERFLAALPMSTAGVSSKESASAAIP
ncbi:MAG: YSC84-related protein, partial [Acidobacteriota bacterium]